MKKIDLRAAHKHSAGALCHGTLTTHPRMTFCEFEWGAGNHLMMTRKETEYPMGKHIHNRIFVKEKLPVYQLPWKLCCAHHQRRLAIGDDIPRVEFQTDSFCPNIRHIRQVFRVKSLSLSLNNLNRSIEIG
jgi:hypothetical protein